MGLCVDELSKRPGQLVAAYTNDVEPKAVSSRVTPNNCHSLSQTVPFHPAAYINGEDAGPAAWGLRRA